jgi:hypothetical protein
MTNADQGAGVERAPAYKSLSQKVRFWMQVSDHMTQFCFHIWKLLLKSQKVRIMMISSYIMLTMPQKCEILSGSCDTNDYKVEIMTKKWIKPLDIDNKMDQRGENLL